MIDPIEILKVIFLGIVEGITEWLPVSSTGHMILVDEFLKLGMTPAFMELFLVVIQLGAIAAVPILFFNKLVPFGKGKSTEEKNRIWSLWLKVIVGVLPAAVLGFLLDDFLDEHLYNFVVVAIALVVYGVAFIVIERLRRGKEFRIESVYDITYKDALIIGAYQVLSLIPGTSRSGSTILGGMLTGVSRTAASEFSFFLAIPVMLGASLLKVAKLVLELMDATDPTVYIPDGAALSYVIYLLVGMVVAFLVSLAVIKFLMDFVKRHSFAAFGVYRIVLGAILIGYWILKLNGVFA